MRLGGARWIHHVRGDSVPLADAADRPFCAPFDPVPSPPLRRPVPPRRVASPMATNLSVDTFLTGVRSSGLIPKDQVDRILAEVAADRPEAIADELIRK